MYYHWAIYKQSRWVTISLRWSRGAGYENGQLRQGDFISSAMADYVSPQAVYLLVDEGMLTPENYARLIFWRPSIGQQLRK